MAEAKPSEAAASTYAADVAVTDEDVTALVDAHYLICVLDRNGVIVQFNAACEHSTGYARNDVIGRDARDVVIPDDEKEAFGAFLAEAWATRKSNPQLGHWLTRTGERRLIAWTNRPLMRGERVPSYLLTAGLDLTERGPASGELERLHAELQEKVVEISALFEEQSALRRVATLVASGAAPDAVFQAVSAEMARFLGTRTSAVLRYGTNETAIVVGRYTEDDYQAFPLGSTVPLSTDSAVARVYRSCRPSRVESYSEVEGHVGTTMRSIGARASIGAPIEVEGKMWGAVVVVTGGEAELPPGAEERLHGFAELVSLAVASADARAQLLESRARLVQASDAERRRLERNLHDGAQQRLVTASVTLQLAKTKVETDPDEAARLIEGAAQELTDAQEELRELARGLHPSLLSDRGIRPAIQALAARAPLPVAVHVPDERLPESVEIAAYYVIAEALTNVAKYAEAREAAVGVTRTDDSIVVSVADDGVGGADPAGGSGLRGLADRVEALGGELRVHSAPGRGTRVTAHFPV